MRSRVPFFLCLLLLLTSCGEKLTVEVYIDILADRLVVADGGGDPDDVLAEYGVEREEYERFELEVLSEPELAAEVVELLRREHPDVFPPDTALLGEGGESRDE